MKKQGKKRNYNNKKQKLRQERGHIVYKNMTLPQLIPDELRCEVGFSMLPTNTFNAASTGSSINYYANSMFNILSGVPGITTYGTGKFDDYERYRVERSEITLTIASRELTKNQFLFLTPTMLNTPITSANFDEYQNLPFTKRSIVGPVTSGQSVIAITQDCDMSKFVGHHYKQQDEYTGAISGGVAADPLTPIFWVFAFYNPDTNTLTTGGITVQAILRQYVTFYQPVRNAGALLSRRNRSASLDGSRKVVTTTQTYYE